MPDSRPTAASAGYRPGSSATGAQEPIGWRRRAILFILISVVVLNVVLCVSVGRDKRVIRSVAHTIVPDGAQEKDVVATLARYVRDEVHHCNRNEVLQLPLLTRWNYLYNPFRIGPKTALDHGAHHTGSCGSSSRVLMGLLSAFDIESRFIILLDRNLQSRHTLLEVFYQGTWGAVDPLYNIVYRDNNGRPASLSDLREQPVLFLANATQGWEYGYGPQGKQARHTYNTKKKRFDNAQYFNYGKFGILSRSLYRVLSSVFGPDAPLWIRRPNFYAYPALTTLVALDGLLVCACCVWLFPSCLRRARRKWGSRRA